MSQIKELLSLKCKAKTSKDFLNIDQIDEALKVNLAQKVHFLMGKSRENRDKLSKKDFINSAYALDIVKLSNAHIRYVAFWYFKNKLDDQTAVKCLNNKKNLTNLCKLYGLNQLYLDSISCYESGYFIDDLASIAHKEGTAFSEMIIQAIKAINLELRP